MYDRICTSPRLAVCLLSSEMTQHCLYNNITEKENAEVLTIGIMLMKNSHILIKQRTFTVLFVPKYKYY